MEGSYIEVKTLFVNEDKTKALDILLFVKLSETKLSIYVTQKNF
ncbi:ABC transporter substrate-binding protein [Enterococcus faecium]|nr:ABC transporter substrate-binding protein [Enterococcus faecium]TKN51372.1 ABC transporter substrate-binding protein [Enterococcus faecium]TKN51812.1 ABC transporter substrate-binding protein [Enterococcus faecium]TKN67943.1 ABC transporter substrate-binding protein [Enterococcus faecium]TKN74802.1 ABC transporter substrate-binding protein [Enterococcus faecium]